MQSQSFFIGKESLESTFCKLVRKNIYDTTLDL